MAIPEFSPKDPVNDLCICDKRNPGYDFPNKQKSPCGECFNCKQGKHRLATTVIRLRHFIKSL